MQFVRFLFAGGTGALANILTRYGLDVFLSYSFAILLAYLVGMITTYVLSRLFVFEKTDENTSKQFGKFALVNFGAIGIVWLVSVGLARGVFPSVGMDFYPDDIAHIIGVGSTAVSSYVMHKYFTFKTRF